MTCLIVSVVLTILSIILTSYITWRVTRHFSTKSTEHYKKANLVLADELKKITPINELANKEDRIVKATEACRRGTVHLVNYLKSLSIPDDEKAEIYDSALIRKKGKPGKNNPFKQPT